MKAIIVDDERLARQELRSMLQRHPEIDIVAEAKNAIDAEEKIRTLSPDLVFLDIQMPGKTGFELLEELDVLPIVVFVTAYDEHALKAFDYSALDYLLKPLEPARLALAIDKAKEEFKDNSSYSESNADDSSSSNSNRPAHDLGLKNKVFLKDGERCWFVALEDISHLESIGNYTRVFFNNEHALIRRSLNQLEERLPDEYFFRASRQHIIHLGYVEQIEPAMSGNLEVTLKGKHSVELSRRQSSAFKEKMSF
jgi:two-component system LytT family response regulator